MQNILLVLREEIISKLVSNQYTWIALFLLAAMPVLIACEIPVLGQIVGFIVLTFIPGFLILRIIKPHKLGVTESLLYSVGLSIAFVMFLGLFTFHMITKLPGLASLRSNMVVLLKKE